MTRSSKVIIPYERLTEINLSLYQDGFVVRLLPEQYFEASGIPREEFLDANHEVAVGDNAFVLYRTHDSLKQLPPLEGWEVRSLQRNGRTVSKRGRDVVDLGHYILRMPTHGGKPKRFEGPPQGVFAPEYADEEANFLSKCVLAWLTIQTQGSPYTMSQAGHLRAILRQEALDDPDAYARRGVVRQNLTACPLCMRFISYPELHQTVSFDDQQGLTNASEQVEGATRSTVVNLFHIFPLLYDELTHEAGNVAWGHAVCNTRLGQRRCYSLVELVEQGRKVGIIDDEGFVETFGWISEDRVMIRSPEGAVWIQLNSDIADGAPGGPEQFDEVVDSPADSPTPTAED